MRTWVVLTSTPAAISAVAAHRSEVLEAEALRRRWRHARAAPGSASLVCDSSVPAPDMKGTLPASPTLIPRAAIVSGEQTAEPLRHRCGAQAGVRLGRGEPAVLSVIQRKVIQPADFADVAALADRLERSEDRYHQTAQPFDWRFTRDEGDPAGMAPNTSTN